MCPTTRRRRSLAQGQTVAACVCPVLRNRAGPGRAARRGRRRGAGERLATPLSSAGSPTPGRGWPGIHGTAHGRGRGRGAPALERRRAHSSPSDGLVTPAAPRRASCSPAPCVGQLGDPDQLRGAGRDVRVWAEELPDELEHGSASGRSRSRSATAAYASRLGAARLGARRGHLALDHRLWCCTCSVGSPPLGGGGPTVIAIAHRQPPG